MMQSPALRALCLAILILPSFALYAQETEDVPPAVLRDILGRSYGQNPLWDDGTAELATYEAVRVFEGQPRNYTARLITVYEDLTKEYYTKADWPYGQKPILPVLKQNMIATIQTDNQPCNFMSSIYVDRMDFGDTVKIAVSTQEWSGTTYKEYQLWRDQPIEIYHTCKDGEGSGQRPLRPGGTAFFEEELFLTLRSLLFKEGLRASFDLYPIQTTNDAPVPSAEPSQLKVSDGGETWTVDVRSRDGRTIQYDFDKDYPHVLHSFVHSDGREMTLRSVERTAYWN